MTLQMDANGRLDGTMCASCQRRYEETRGLIARDASSDDEAYNRKRAAYNAAMRKCSAVRDPKAGRCDGK